MLVLMFDPIGVVTMIRVYDGSDYSWYCVCYESALFPGFISLKVGM